MKRYVLCSIIILGLQMVSLYAQDTELPTEVQFKILRQEDNLEVLLNKEQKSLYERFKLISIGENSSISFGGSIRLQAESFINEQFEDGPGQDNIWFLERTLLHSHVKLNNKFEVFLELNNSLITGKDNLVPVDKDALSINQFFMKYHFDKHWDITVGRENLKLGGRRLIDIREGPNVRRSFDMAMLEYRTDKFWAKGFFSTPVQPQPDSFDNDFLEFDETFSGVYSTTQLNSSSGLDVYFLYQKDNNVTYNNGIANERRASVGVRHFGNYKSLTFNNEFVYQFGSFGSQNISAWTLSFHLENKTPLFAHDFNIGLKTELISGDRNNEDNTLNTFDALYPRGAYFGRVARFGPSNLIDLHPYINTTVNKFFFEIDYDVFWRYSTEDGLYNPALLLEYPDNNDKSFIAHQLGTLIGYTVNNFISLELETNFILPGDFLKQSGLTEDLFHFVFTTEFKF